MKEVVVGVVSRQRADQLKEYLLVSSRLDFGEFTGCYYPPGGHIAAGESKEETLVRKIRDELGVKAHPTKEIAITLGDVPNQLTYWWECQIVSWDSMVINKEAISNAGFFTQQEMKVMKLWPATRKFFNEHVFL